MPDAENPRFAEALAHWAEDVALIRARERAQAIARVEEVRSTYLMGALHTSALWQHYAWKRRGHW